ncbi:Fc.00g022050.m01.CDS01 [Cosmosporella sp. VM-42]
MAIPTALAFLSLFALSEGIAMPRTCPVKVPYPSGVVCGSRGYVSNKDGISEYEIQRSNPEECAELCFEDTGCQVFNYEDGRCLLFHNSMEKLGFDPKDTEGRLWYELGCFSCENKNQIVFHDDFSDGDVDNWTMIKTGEDDYFMDVQTVTLYNGQSESALRILEAVMEGHVEVRPTNQISLTGGTAYILVFTAMVDTRGQAWQQDNFSPLGVLIYNDAQRVFEAIPSGGTQLGKNWYQFKMVFEVPEGQDGSYWLSLLVDASGMEVDWYFGDVSLEALP